MMLTVFSAYQLLSTEVHGSKFCKLGLKKL